MQAAQRASADLAEVPARVEAGIDFTDSEDVVAIAREELRRRVAAVEEELARWVAGSVPLESTPQMPVVALRGAPNAGKSSLFNALLGRTRAVASPSAGTTRDAIAEEIEFRSAPAGAPEPGVRAMLVDTPGIEDPRSAIDALMQEQGRAADRADVILLCEPLASLVAASPGDAHVRIAGAADGHWRAGEWRSRASKVIHVATRCDEVRSGARGAAAGMLCTSAVTGEGIEALAASVAAALASECGGTGSSHRIGVLARHRHAMVLAGEWLSRCMDAAGDGAGSVIGSPELVADALRGALDALGEVTGEVTPDDVLGLVFSRFCIGK
ncbi:MAG: GTP-binding protein [Phycisphaerales bacterium]|nr:GTP-binding protein [Phycisphaerales bacterium]